MAKKSRTKTRESTPGEVGPRQPCPCGSGRRYKACHGAEGGAAAVYVARPFEGLPSECDIVALRELVPSATAPLTVKGTDRPVTLCTLLPMASPAMYRDSGQVWLGLQVVHNFGDPARDLGAALQLALDAEEPGVIGLTDPPGEGPRLQDLVSDDSARRHRARRLRLLDRRRRGQGRPRRRARAGQLLRRPDRAADARSRRRTGPTSAPRSTCAG